ncbi:unnamed protein product, partial [Rotaria sp. Silwood2]
MATVVEDIPVVIPKE